METAPQAGSTRREFLKGGAVALGAALLRGRLASAEDARTGVRVCIFSKHLQWLDYEGMAETAAELGFDGVDLTVRPRGHVLPERVEDDLPRAVEAVRKAGLEVPMMVTAITDPDDPLTEKILRTASQLGIRYYRLGYWRYPKKGSPAVVLEDIRKKAEALAAMNRQYGLVGDYQNHAGENRVGAAIWDLWYIMRDLDPRWLGVQFDVRHATVEGGTSWPTDFRLIAERVHTVVAKDFFWGKVNGRWEARNCPLGEGMVDFLRYFRMLKRVGFSGPITVHYEYPLGGANHGARELTVPKTQVLTAMRSDLRRLRGWLNECGLI